ncbi:hypothetical protein ACLI09_05845 [Flavobacterium sp. RHBU_24]|uniref:hypothetical protein n=1 Tax=Flavobacterium sp. RHBU_24 TaxID=3391185 RepID=UPI0039849C25
MAMDKDNFIKIIQELRLNLPELDKAYPNFNKKKYFGLRVTKDYILVYINIREKHLQKFNYSLNSFKLSDGKK